MDENINILKGWVEDNEQFSSDKNTKNILKNEDLIYSDKITKIIENIREERSIMITTGHVYNYKKKKYRSKIKIEDIKYITLSSKNDTFILHIQNKEYDVMYDSENKIKIIELISRLNFDKTHCKILVSLKDTEDLSSYFTLKQDKKTDIEYTKFDFASQIDIDKLLYGNMYKNYTDTFCSITLAQKTENILPPLDGIDFRDLRIENFYLMEHLALSNFGDFYLAKFKANNEFYLVRTINSNDTDQFCSNLELIMNVMYNNDFSYLAKLDFFLKTKSTFYLFNKFGDNFTGGFLFQKLRDIGYFSEKTVRFLAVQIILIMEYMHKNGVKFCGMMPENFLLDSDGYLKYVGYELEYELIRKNQHFLWKNKRAKEFELVMNDWYNLGVILYELLFNYPPSFNSEKKLIYPSIFKRTEACRDLLDKLMDEKEYANLSIETIKQHEFFAGVNFEDIRDKKVQVEFHFLKVEREINQSLLKSYGFVVVEKTEEEIIKTMLRNFNCLDDEDDWDDDDIIAAKHEDKKYLEWTTNFDG